MRVQIIQPNCRVCCELLSGYACIIFGHIFILINAYNTLTSYIHHTAELDKSKFHLQLYTFNVQKYVMKHLKHNCDITLFFEVLPNQEPTLV